MRNVQVTVFILRYVWDGGRLGDKRSEEKVRGGECANFYYIPTKHRVKGLGCLGLFLFLSLSIFQTLCLSSYPLSQLPPYKTKHRVKDLGLFGLFHFLFN